MSEIVAVNGDDFKGATHQDGTTFRLSLEGTADFAALDSLEVLLDRTHAEALRFGIAGVVVDLRKLEFMNASCFKCLLSWITSLQELELDARYKVEFLSSAKRDWQRRSLHSLRCFAVELVSVVES